MDVTGVPVARTPLVGWPTSPADTRQAARLIHCGRKPSETRDRGTGREPPFHLGALEVLCRSGIRTSIRPQAVGELLLYGPVITGSRRSPSHVFT